MRSDKAAESWPDASIYRYRWNCGTRYREKGIPRTSFKAVIKWFRYTVRTPTVFRSVLSASHAEEKLSPCRATIYMYILTHEYRETSDRRVCNLPLPGFVPVILILALAAFPPCFFLMRFEGSSRTSDYDYSSFFFFCYQHFSISLSDNLI